VTSVVVRNLTKAFAGVRAVDNVSFAVNEGEILVIVGASGCGKTTTLRCIAGLEQPTSGTIEIDGRPVASDSLFVPPEKRGIGMMFQSYALWPHKSVFDNIAYGLVLRKRSKVEIRDAVQRALRSVGLENLANRFPSTLSGGQQQRVALARATVVEPKVLLLDEPLSNLDAKLREQMRVDLRQLVKSLKMTAIHITHDQSEAMAIADKVIYMRNGQIQQEGSPRDLYRRPASRAVAEFVGTATFLEGEVVPGSNSEDLRVRISTNAEIRVAVMGCSGGNRMILAVRPECVTLSETKPEGDNVFAAVVRSQVFLGDVTEYIVETSGITMKCRNSADHSVGTSLFVKIDPRDVICLPR
jgi:ABC-type Fe3+/spermidine/putrescine transport system ATPase subunit